MSNRPDYFDKYKTLKAAYSFYNVSGNACLSLSLSLSLVVF